MANLIIKSSADNLVLQGSDASPAITVGATGTTTFAENATFSGTANALGTVTSGNLSSEDIVMPRFKELSSFLYETHTSTSTLDLDGLNISGSNYLTLTPEHTGDVIQFTYSFNTYCSDNYIGFGIQSATDTGFSANLVNTWRTGRHAIGRFGQQSTDGGEYSHYGGVVTFTASSISLSADTTYYFRMVGMTHGQAGTMEWGTGATNSIKDGIKFSAKRWSIV